MFLVLSYFFGAIIFLQISQNNATREFYGTGIHNSTQFEEDKVADDADTAEKLKFFKRGTGENQKHKRDMSHLQAVCSFYPETYISMEEISGVLTPVQKLRYVPLCCPGYMRTGDDLDSYKCVPACNFCTFGICTSPNRCKCDDGYENPSGNAGTCIPKCFPSCRNSHCAGPDRCVCEKGFEHDDFFPNQCIKKNRNHREIPRIQKQRRQNEARRAKRLSSHIRNKRNSEHIQIDPCFAPGTINCPTLPRPANNSNPEIILNKRKTKRSQQNKKKRNLDCKNTNPCSCPDTINCPHIPMSTQNNMGGGFFKNTKKEKRSHQNKKKRNSERMQMDPCFPPGSINCPHNPISTPNNNKDRTVRNKRKAKPSKPDSPKIKRSKN